MSFDAFEARLQFLQLIRKLNASAQSIQKVVGFAVKYGSRCGEDLWECVMDECAKGTLNTRINILYFLDSLLEVSQSLGPPDAPYQAYISRDLPTLVNNVVPPTREGVLNLRSARLILDSWRMRRVLEGGVVESVIAELDRRAESGSKGFEEDGDGQSSKRSHSQAFSRNDILRRMEEDRERHKRLRERIWILPIPPLISKSAITSSNSAASANPTPSPSSPFTPASPSTRPPPSSAAGTAGTGAGAGKMLPPPPPSRTIAPSTLDALEMEFEQTWESAGTLADDDLQRMKDDARAAGLTA